MMDNGDSPPPAYSEQEFDQKVSLAVSASLTTSQPYQTQDEEEWEEYDEAAFEAAAHSGSASSAPSVSIASRSVYPSTGNTSHRYPLEKASRSNLPASVAVEPLRIHKKTSSGGKAGFHKLQPKESQGEPFSGPSSPSSPQGRRATRSGLDVGGGFDIASAYTPHHAQLVHNLPTDDERYDFTIPPPPFAPVSPINGTPVVVMTYDPSASVAPSPLNSPVNSHRPLLQHSSQMQGQPIQRQHCSQQQPVPSESSRRLPRHSLPTPPRTQIHNAGQRPITTSGPRAIQPSGVPRMEFNPLIAYNRNDGSPDSPRVHHYVHQSQMTSFAANAFYNSAVSAHLSTPKPPPSKSPGLNMPPHQSSYNLNHQPSAYNTEPTQIQHPNLYASSDGGNAWPSASLDNGYQQAPMYPSSQHPQYSPR